MLYCKNCGASVREGSKFCTSCGAPITAPEAPAAQEPAYSQPPAHPQEPPFSPPPSYPQEPAYQQQSYHTGGYQRDPYQQQMVYRQPEPRYGGPAPLRGGVTIGGILSRAMGILRTKPLLLWGLSLMYALLTVLATSFGVIPIISLPIKYALLVGMKAIYLDGIRGREVNSDQLFAGFNNFFRSAGGIAWRELWLLIWALIPLAGFVMVIIKSYSYRFVPYIMVEDSEISATAALRRSKELTYGMRGKMFGADLLMIGIVFGVDLLLVLLSLIPYIGVLFMLVLFVFSLLVAALFPLFVGLVEAAFYDECPRK